MVNSDPSKAPLLLVLSDREIDDPKVIDFVRTCLMEIGGLPQVSQALEAEGLDALGEDASPALVESTRTRVLRLDRVDSATLREGGRIILETIDECGDLEVLVGVDREGAKKLLELLPPSIH